MEMESILKVVFFLTVAQMEDPPDSHPFPQLGFPSDLPYWLQSGATRGRHRSREVAPCIWAEKSMPQVVIEGFT